LCKFCRFQEFCPAFGGNPGDAAPTMAALAAQGAA